VTSDLKAAGNPLFLVGKSNGRMGGSLWARRAGENGLALPPADEPALRHRGESLLQAMRRGLIRSCHDISDGGLAVTLAEMAFGAGLGFDVDLRQAGLATAPLALAAEGGSRWVVEVAADGTAAFQGLFEENELHRLGTVSERDGRLRWAEKTLAAIDLKMLYDEWRAGLGRAIVPLP
jgi:phosphoribosylformylglycinamidine (FGAM) synthase-like enzyme